MVSSVLLLPLFEVEASWDGGTYYGDRIFGAVALGLRTSSWVPALVALGFATAFLHYLLDRAVYRLSDPQVRSAARGAPYSTRSTDGVRLSAWATSLITSVVVGRSQSKARCDGLYSTITR
jgi:hypothetical protein